MSGLACGSSPGGFHRDIRIVIAENGVAFMKMTIITAVFNGSERIAATLQSVASQDHAQIEHIVVDGGSRDGTVEVVLRNSERVARLISEPDTGAYDAFNKGLRASTGDAIGFLGCGDIYSSRATISSIAKAFADSSVDAVFGDLVIVREDNAERVIRRYRSNAFSPGRMAYGFMPAHPTLFLRRQVYEHIGEYSTKYKIAADFELCLRVFAKLRARYAYIPEVLVRMRAGGLSNNGWRSKLAITEEMRRACASNGIVTNRLKLYGRFPFKILEMLPF